MKEHATNANHVLSVDIGGTFTDFSLLDLSTGRVSVHKVLSDPQDPARVLIKGAAELLDAEGTGFEGLRLLVHSTTLATNAIIERTGAKTGLLTTRGFRDILQMGHEQIYDIYDLQAQFPEPLVPRYLRREVNERVTRDGDVLQRPDETEALDAVAEMARAGAEAVAISLLHSYKNPVNERTLKALIESRYPDLTLSLSSEVAPIINEYERTSTTVADCYIKPSVSGYLRNLTEKLSQSGYPGRLMVMHSAGGMMAAEQARERPIRLLESGPAAGAQASSFYSGLLGRPDLISLDMGGTTAKTCVIENGRPTATNGIEVARVRRFTKGSGLPITIPLLDLIEIGSGGGSIAWVDTLGLLRVGPQSARASPGPACYRLGGEEPTVTDANLVLGYLDPEYFLGGNLALDAGAARSAISRLGCSLGMGDVETAWGVYSVVTENMAAAARIHIIERNKDPRRYALIAFGGAGPAHACQVARILGVKQVVVPLAAGVTSALGCLTAPLSFETVRSLPALLGATKWSGVNNLYEEMRGQCLDMLTGAGVREQQIRFVRSADMRLAGQIHEINVPVPGGTLEQGSVQPIETGFHGVYEELYSRRNLNLPIEVRNWRLLATGPQPDVRLREEPVNEEADAREALKGTRSAYFGPVPGYVDCAVYDRYRLTPGCKIPGPAIIEEEESTAVISHGDRAFVDRWFNLIIDVGSPG